MTTEGSAKSWSHVEPVTEAIQEFINERTDKGGMVTKWVLVTEVMETDGTKNITRLRSPSPEACPIWDVRGMLFDALYDQELFDD